MVIYLVCREFQRGGQERLRERGRRFCYSMASWWLVLVPWMIGFLVIHRIYSCLLQQVVLWWQDGITWLLLPPDQSLTFLLADNGFDVWLANTRGSTYSRGHTSLSPNEPVSSLFPTCYSLLPFSHSLYKNWYVIQAYWDWSWDELVAYDLPATFQYVHDKAGQKLHYVGHSLVSCIHPRTPFCSRNPPTYRKNFEVILCRELWLL